MLTSLCFLYVLNLSYLRRRRLCTPVVVAVSLVIRNYPPLIFRSMSHRYISHRYMSHSRLNHQRYPPGWVQEATLAETGPLVLIRL
jgi:hypothetical protein